MLEDKGTCESLAAFKQHFFQAQDRCRVQVGKSRKSGKEGRRPAWMIKELIDKIEGKKKVYEMWKKGLSSWEEYRRGL